MRQVELTSQHCHKKTIAGMHSREWSSENARSPTSPGRPTPVRLLPASVRSSSRQVKHGKNSVWPEKAPFSTTSSLPSSGPANGWNTPACLPPRHTMHLPLEESRAAALGKSPRSPGCNRHLISGLCASVPVPEPGEHRPTYPIESRTRRNIEHVGTLIAPTFPAGTSFAAAGHDERVQFPEQECPALGDSALCFAIHASLFPAEPHNNRDSRPLAHQQCHQLQRPHPGLQLGSSAKARVRKALPIRTRRAEASSWPGASSVHVALRFRFYVGARETNRGCTGGCWS